MAQKIMKPARWIIRESIVGTARIIIFMVLWLGEIVRDTIRELRK